MSEIQELLEKDIFPGTLSGFLRELVASPLSDCGATTVIQLLLVEFCLRECSLCSLQKRNPVYFLKIICAFCEIII